MKPYGSTVQQITTLIMQLGPLTREEICVHLNMDRMNVSAVISRMNKASVATPKRLRITGYTSDSEVSRRYPRAIYDLGDKPNAKKFNRKATRRESRKRYDKKRAVINTMNFVFNLAKPRRLYAI